MHLRRAHFLRIPFAVKKDKAPRPIDIGYLGTNAVMARAQMIPQAIQKFGCRPPVRWAWHDQKIDVSLLPSFPQAVELNSVSVPTPERAR